MIHYTSMFRKLGEAVIILRRSWLLFSGIILTVWLPGNLLVNYLAYYVFPDLGALKQARATMWIEGIFGPVYIGAMVYALSCRHLLSGRQLALSGFDHRAGQRRSDQPAQSLAQAVVGLSVAARFSPPTLRSGLWLRAVLQRSSR